MGKIFVIMGKTSSGKDTIYEWLMEHLTLNQGVRGAGLKNIVTYTTRPMRPGEEDGVQYFFVTEERLQELRRQGKVLEERCYHTVHGPWYYFTAIDGQIDLEKQDYLMVNTLAGFEKLCAFYNKPEWVNGAASDIAAGCGEDNRSTTVIPLYIEADPKDRLLRYINRESQQTKPNYSEVCRRFLADEADFAEEELKRLGITKRYFNRDLEVCCEEIEQDIKRCLAEFSFDLKEGQKQVPVSEDSLQNRALSERGQCHG